MTYFPGVARPRASVAIFEWSPKAAHSVGDLFDLSLVSHTFEATPALTNGDSINLTQGDYMAQAFIYAEKVSASQNLRFQFHIDGVAVGVYGQTDMMDNVQADTADAVLRVDEGGASLDLRLIGVENSLPTIVSAHSWIALWRVAAVQGV